MSVRKGDQGQGRLSVLEHSKNMLRYTYERVIDKTFPKAERWLMPKSIWAEAHAAHSKITRANKIKVSNKCDAEARLLLEEEAIGHLDELNALIDTCHALNKISDDRANYWTGLVCKTQEIALKWLKSQKEEYKQFLE